MTARLRAARQMQTDFVANVSHELRTPLTAVKGTVETLRDGAVDDPEVRDRFLETVEAETDRLIRLVNDLLILSRADSEALNLQREPLDLAALARSTVRKLTPQAEARRVSPGRGRRPGAPLALADADRIEQVLVNLLDNAIKYSPPGGTVRVRVAGGFDGTVEVRVRTRASASPPRSWRASASVFTAPTEPAPAPRAAAAWAWPSPRRWSRPTAASSGWRARRARGRQ